MSRKAKQVPENEQVEAEIRAAFASVTREGGVSWRGAIALDIYATAEEVAREYGNDTDRDWAALIDDPTWNLGGGVGGFSFLDPIGFRYYLAPAMIRCLKNAEGGDSVAFALTLLSSGGRTSSKGQAFRARQLSLLTAAQRSAVLRFLRFMIDSSSDPTPWRDALRGGWEEWDLQQNVGPSRPT